MAHWKHMNRKESVMAFVPAAISVTSPAFDDGEAIPHLYSAEGENISPPLTWSGVPESTAALAVFCHDPDAPLAKPGSYGFTHWVLYNLPWSINGLEEATSMGSPGTNDYGKPGYGGPNPPKGHGVHYYYFWLVALDKELHLPSGLTLEQFLEKSEPHIIGMNRLRGTYRRD